MVDSAKEDTPRFRRSPSFSREEILLLLKLVERYKLFVLNKSTNAAANNAKDAAWIKIAKQFNNSNLGHVRSVDTLKGKWENLKRTIKKTSKNLIESDSCELDDINSRVIALITASDSIGSIDTPQDMLDGDIDQNDIIDNASEAPKDMESDADDNNEKNARFRSQNFSPLESKLLLQCVRKEKKHVFSKEITSKAIEVKNQAWSRIANSYNRLSPQKRSTKCLRMKFTSMKKMARKFGSKDMLVKNFGKHGKRDSFKNIKEEPFFEEKMDDESDQYSDHDNNDYNDVDEEDNFAAPADPLSSVLNGNSGIGSASSQTASWNWTQTDNKEIIKLQKELLNYQIETAKLERKRVEEAMLEEGRERESRATERALRLRAARLDAAASAARLPAAHPALLFPPDEARAHRYLAQYHS